jgi:hypothetical protein
MRPSIHAVVALTVMGCLAFLLACAACYDLGHVDGVATCMERR